MMQCPQVYVNLNLLKIETLQGIHLIGVADMVNEYINENVKKVIKSLTNFKKYRSICIYMTSTYGSVF